MKPHRLAASDFAALSQGAGGADAVRDLVASRRSRTLLMIRLIVDAATDPVVRQAFDVLASIQRVAPEAVNRVLDHPSVGAWATRTALRPHQANAADLAFVAAAAAVRGRVTTPVRLPPCAEIPLPSLGTVLRSSSGMTLVRCEQETMAVDGVQIPVTGHEDAPEWRAVPVIGVSDSISFLLGGWRAGELPPQLRTLDAFDVSLWRDRLVEGWDLLVRHHRTVADELAAAVTVLTPLRTSGTTVSSATLADAFGCLFLSLAPDAQSVAVTLAHELQHTKLIALTDLFPMLEPDPRAVFYAPWRNDPRPLAGLLHGTYAYVGVTAFWRRQRLVEASPAAEERANTAFARWRTATLGAARSLLASGKLTPTGRAFVEGMAGVLEQWCSEPVPRGALRAATQLSNEHRAQWLVTHGTGQRGQAGLGHDGHSKLTARTQRT